MSEQQLFQESPKDTDACTLVTDTPASNKVREAIKKLVFKKLKPKVEDYEIVENQFQWSITQRYVEKPAIMNVRLKSFKRGMKLTAYNSFEIYHGNCNVASMRVRNDLDETKLESHVNDAIKSFKEQAEFGKDEAIRYRKNNDRRLKRELKLYSKLLKEFKGFNFETNKDGLIKIFKRSNHYYPRTQYTRQIAEQAHQKAKVGEYVQLLDVIRCNKFTFVPKAFKPAKSINETFASETDSKVPWISAQYRSNDNVWRYTIYGLKFSQISSMYLKHENGTTFLKYDTYEKKKVKATYMPHIEFWKASSYSSGRTTYNQSVFEYVATTKDFIKLVDELGMKVWKIRMD